MPDDRRALINSLQRLFQFELILQGHSQVVLKFPIARLFIHDLIVKHGLSAPQAMARAACEFGVVGEYHLNKEFGSSANASCSCMHMAENIFYKHFQNSSHKSILSSDRIKEAWSAIKKDMQNYQELCGSQQQEKFSADEKVHDCARFAPALFDLLLQQIRRYPE